MLDFELKKNNASDFEFFSSCQKLHKNLYNVSVFENKNFSSFLVLNSDPVPPHVLSTSFSSIEPSTVAAYTIFVN